jgi:hypothetical protein
LSIDAVRGMGVGSGLPGLMRVTVGEVISVAGVWLAVVAGKVDTVPVTETRLPMAAIAGGVELVNTSMPSGVRGFASIALSGVWIKKPLERTAVTMPLVWTDVPA